MYSYFKASFPLIAKPTRKLAVSACMRLIKIIFVVRWKQSKRACELIVSCTVAADISEKEP